MCSQAGIQQTLEHSLDATCGYMWRIHHNQQFLGWFQPGPHGEMSGLELFMDGGATLAGAVSAGAALLGYKQQKEDDSELVEDEEELERLRQNLGEAITSTCAAHAAITAAWGESLSLFVARGAQSLAVEALEAAKRLVEEAAELEDLADVYDAQLQLAITKRRGLRRTPLRHLETRLDGLSLALTAHVPAVVLAKEAFKRLELGEGDAVTLQAALQTAKSYSEAGMESRCKSPISAGFTGFTMFFHASHLLSHVFSSPAALSAAPRGIFVASSFPLLRAMSC